MTVSGDGFQTLEAEVTPMNIPRAFSGENESTFAPLSIQQIFLIPFLNSDNRIHAFRHGMLNFRFHPTEHSRLSISRHTQNIGLRKTSYQFGSLSLLKHNPRV
jgi:hypothetical protein